LAGDIFNPQSLNRYAYVGNNPTTLVDPLGLENCHVTDSCGRNGGAGYNDARPFYAGGCPSFFPATYNAYLLACQYAESSCSGTSDRVSVKLVGYNYNVQLLRNPLDVAAASADGYSDPTSSMFHQGNDSYYVGFGGLFGIDEGHVVADPNGIEAHYDDFGPLNPLHWPGAILSLFVNTRSTAPAIPYTCSVVGGCHQ
jgi:hypothetical protein